MPKSSVSYICQQCGYATYSWLGKCPECGTWNSFVESIIKKSSSLKGTGPARLSEGMNAPISFEEIEKEELERIPTGIAELDRTLGGGIVPGSAVLLGGDPGIGKSTLLLQVALNLSERNLHTIIIAGEESPGQIKLRVERIVRSQSIGSDGNFSEAVPNVKKFPASISDHIKILPQTNVDQVIETLGNEKPNFVIIDSIQTMFTQELDGTSGSVGQVRESAWRLVKYAKNARQGERKVPVFLIGHVTKEGTIAGPRVLEHLVDTVLYMEGERYHTYRILRSIKNRFGKSDEIGIFEMTGEGMKEVANPSLEFLGKGGPQVGSVVVSTMEGSRPILAEIQALTSTTIFGMPKRSANGIDLNRLNMLAAVLSRRAGIQLGNQDIYVNVAGGLKIAEPAVDLGVCLAIASNVLDKVLPEQTVAIGEVGLQGEVRSVPGLERRISEAKKIGFKNFITSEQIKTVRNAIQLLEK